MNIGKKIGYIRVSTVEQNTDRQLDGLELDKYFVDKWSGKDTARPQLQAMLEYVREGDIIIVHSIDRIARDLCDLLQLVKTLTSQGVTIEFCNEHLIYTAEKSPIDEMLLSNLGAYAQFERAISGQRRDEGIAIAKAKGVYKGGKPKLTDEQVQEIKAQAQAGVKIADIARSYDISRQSVYNYLSRANKIVTFKTAA